MRFLDIRGGKTIKRFQQDSRIGVDTHANDLTPSDAEYVYAFV
jgi:hypothetical protein